LHLLTAIGCPDKDLDVRPTMNVLPDAMQKVKDLLINFGIEKGQRLVLLHPGSGHSARDWSPKNFGILGKRISEIPHVRLIITGGASEESLVESVISMIGNSAISIVNKLSLGEYAALAKSSSLFIANSTGPIHIAAAVGTPVIGLYPQVTALCAARWGPYTDNKLIFTPQGQPTNCKKCIRKKTTVCECMDSILVDDVFTAVEKFLVKNSFK